MIKTVFFSLGFGTLLMYAIIVFLLVGYIMIKVTNNALTDIHPKQEHSVD